MHGMRTLQVSGRLISHHLRDLPTSLVLSTAKRPRARFHRIMAAAVVAPDPAPSTATPMHSKPDLPSPSALLPCQLDSYARSGTATVLACSAVAVPSRPAKGAGKAAKKGSANAGKAAGAGNDTEAEGSRWLVTLDGGPLYPEGGGQPSDTGTLQLISDGGSPNRDSAQDGPVGAEASIAHGSSGLAPATSVAETEPDTAPADASSMAGVVNVLSAARNANGAVLAIVDAPLPVGARVSISVDWQRRFDLMQQHTGESGR